HNYFLADLPPEATLTPSLLTEACQTLKRNRERYFEDRTTANLIQTIESLAKNWLDPEFPFRKQLLEADPAKTGFSSPILAEGLDSFFKQITADNLETLLIQELGHSQRLDQFCASESDRITRRMSMARGPQLLAHIAPGNIPNPTLMTLLLGLLLRSAQFVKCASGQSYIPRIFSHSLYD